MEKLGGDSTNSRTLNASLIRNVDGKIIGKDGKPLKSALRKPIIPNPKFGPNSAESMPNKEPTLGLHTEDFPSLNTSSKDGTSKSSTSEQVTKEHDSIKPTNSFAGVLMDKPLKKVVKIKEMRNEVNVAGAAITIHFEVVEAVNARFINTLVGYFIGDRLAYPLVENYVKNSWAKYGLKRIQMHEEFFLFQFNTRKGMESVLENGPWLVRRIPLILNEWTPNTILKKDEIKSAPEGHSFATIDVEYEWTPPRCDTCKIFDHISEKCSKLPKEIIMPKANVEGFTDVKSKKSKKQYAKKQVEGIRLSKPKLNLQYRRVDPKSKKSDGNKDGKKHVSEVNLSSEGAASTSKNITNVIKLKNSYSSLEDDETDWDNDGTKLSVIDESDSEDVDEVMVMEEPNGHKNVSRWNHNDADIVVINQDDQSMHVRVWVKADRKEFFCTFVYAHNRYTQRRLLWNNLQLHKLYVRDRPWCILGDFNAALFLHDYSVGNSNINISMREFKECVEDLEILDVQYSGLQFTWTQKPKGNEGLLKKIDRVMANLKFNDVFAGSHAIFKPYRNSDHAPSVLCIPSIIKPKPKPFKFYNLITSNDNFKRVVLEGCKIIDNRIKESLKVLISPNQSAFVPGRSIADNILLTQELMHNYHLDRGVARCAFKVDIQKAYDTVDWVFLKNILAGFGFHDRLIGWIMECVTTTSFSISINGSLHGFFKGKHGLPQGDPLSPYLFTLVMEILTLMLQRGVDSANSFVYHRYCSKMKLINLCFADDLFLFSHGDTDSVKVIKGALNDFQEASRLVPSIPKSKGDCRELIEKVNIRVDDWKNKFLSQREDSNSSVRRFLWKGRSKVAWEAVCLPKDEGGLGVRRLDTFNKALMVSHIWKLLSLKESLWVKWVHIYKLKGRNFRDILIRGRLSWGWRKVLQIRPLIREYIWYSIGDGDKASLWFDNWNTLGPIADYVSCASSNLNNDWLEWRDEGGMVKPFLVLVFWATIRHRNPKVDWYAAVWFTYCIPRHAFNLWLVINRKLKTQDKVASWEVSDSLMTVCSLCEMVQDSHDHISFECPFLQQVWHYMKSFDALPNLNEVFQHILLEFISNYCLVVSRRPGVVLLWLKDGIFRTRASLIMLMHRSSNPNNDRLKWRDEGGMVKLFSVSMVWATIRHRNPKVD
nr:hypothetical protein [Tanacetum cinerariifolium]